jgi:hypothetical protein
MPRDDDARRVTGARINIANEHASSVLRAVIG